MIGITSFCRGLITIAVALAFWAASSAPVPAAAPPLVPFDATTDLLVLEDNCDCVLRITPTGDISIEISSSQILAQTGETGAEFSDSGLAVAADGTVFFIEQTSDSVLRWSGSVLSTVVSESDVLAATGDTETDLEGLAIGSDGMIYVNDRLGDNILQVDPSSDTVTVYVAEADFTALPGVSSVDFEAGIVAAEGGVIFVLSGQDGSPPALFRLDGPGSPVLVTATDPPLQDPENHMTRAPNGDLITGDDNSPDHYYRITPAGDISVFLDETLLDNCANDTIDTSAGIAFDDSGNFFWGDSDSDSIYVIDGGTLGDPTPACQVFASAADIEAVTGSSANISGGIAFDVGEIQTEPDEIRPIPTLGFRAVVLLGGLLLAIGLIHSRYSRT